MARKSAEFGGQSDSISIDCDPRERRDSGDLADGEPDGVVVSAMNAWGGGRDASAKEMGRRVPAHLHEVRAN